MYLFSRHVLRVHRRQHYYIIITTTRTASNETVQWCKLISRGGFPSFGNTTNRIMCVHLGTYIIIPILPIYQYHIIYLYYNTRLFCPWTSAHTRTTRHYMCVYLYYAAHAVTRRLNRPLHLHTQTYADNNDPSLLCVCLLLYRSSCVTRRR